MIYEYSIMCPKCNSFHTVWNRNIRGLICESCNKEIRLELLNMDIHNRLMVGKEDIMVGEKVRVYIKNKYCIGEVIKRYGIIARLCNSILCWPYQDLCDIKIGNYISKGHFTYGLVRL